MENCRHTELCKILLLYSTSTSHDIGQKPKIQPELQLDVLVIFFSVTMHISLPINSLASVPCIAGAFYGNMWFSFSVIFTAVLLSTV